MFLANRVVVMSGGASHGVAGHIAEVVDINLGPERSVTSPEFNELKRRISALFHQDLAVAVD